MTRATLVVGPPVGTAVKAMRSDARGTVLDRGVVSARSLEGVGRVEVTFSDGSTMTYSGRGIRDYMLWEG